MGQRRATNPRKKGKSTVGSARDNFSSTVKTRLAKRAGYLCSLRSCRANTVGPSRESPEATANIGVAAHICAAADGGPRSDGGMPKAMRVSVSNGIWLCQTHASLIDRDLARFTVGVLRSMKVQHEEYVEKNIGVRPVGPATARLAGREISDEAARIILDRLEGGRTGCLLSSCAMR